MSVGLRVGPRVGPKPSPAPGIGAETVSAGLTTGTRWTLTKTGGADGTYDAQAVSQSFTGTVSVTFTIPTVSGGGDAFIIGLSADNPDANYTGIDFGLLDDTGTMYKSENGSLTSLGATVPGDVWKIERTIGTGAVVYYKNGASVNTSSNTSIAALVVDSSIRFSNDAPWHIKVETPTGGQNVTWTVTNVTATQEYP